MSAELITEKLLWVEEAIQYAIDMLNKFSGYIDTILGSLNLVKKLKIVAEVLNPSVVIMVI